MGNSDGMAMKHIWAWIKKVMAIESQAKLDVETSRRITLTPEDLRERVDTSYFAGMAHGKTIGYLEGMQDAREINSYVKQHK